MTSLRAELVAKFPEFTPLSMLLPDVNLAQAFVLLEVWVVLLHTASRKLPRDTLVSPPIRDGDVILVLLASTRDKEGTAAGGVGPLIYRMFHVWRVACRMSLGRIQQSWRAADWVSLDVSPRCDCPRVHSLVQTARALQPLERGYPVCVPMPKGTTVTRRLAACSIVDIGGLVHTNAYSFTVSARKYCRPWVHDHPLPPRGEAWRHLRESCAAYHILKFDAVATRLTNLVIFSINAGGLDAKRPRLLALLVDIEPDIVGVQEAGNLFVDTTFRGVPYRVIPGVVVPGGTLGITVHSRLWSHQQPRVEALEQSLGVYLPVSEKVPLVMSTVHFPPGMPALDRHIHALGVAASHAKYPGGMKLIFGDLNADIRAASGVWIRRLCDDHRYWGGYYVP